MRPASEQLTAPGGLAERLAGLRSAAGLKAVQLAESLGWARSKVSKIENGNQVPTADDIRAWTEATGQPEVTDELIAMLRQVQEAHTRWRRRLREGGQASIQQELDELTRAAVRIRNLQVAIIPGLLQTGGYARGIATQVSAVYGNVDVDAAVAARIKRQEILYEPDRQFEFVFGEAALYMPPCPRSAMLGQLDRLMAMDLANITLGIIPMGAELSMSPLNSFMLLDDLLVVESYGYEDRVGGDLADTHARIFEMLMNESATGEKARRLIASAAERLREELGKRGTAMYEQPQPNYTTQPHYAAPAHVVGDRRAVDWRLIGAYIIAAFALGGALVCLWLLTSFKQVYASQMVQTNRALTAARAVQAKNASTINNLSRRVSGDEAQLILLTPYTMTCSQYLTSPNGGPDTFVFPCAEKKSGS